MRVVGGRLKGGRKLRKLPILSIDNHDHAWSDYHLLRAARCVGEFR